MYDSLFPLYLIIVRMAKESLAQDGIGKNSLSGSISFFHSLRVAGYAAEEKQKRLFRGNSAFFNCNFSFVLRQ